MKVANVLRRIRGRPSAADGQQLADLSPPMSLPEFEEFSFLNQVDVRVTSVESPDAEPDEVFEIVVEGPVIAKGEPWSEAPYLKALDPITFHDGQARRAYVLDVRKSHYSWGVDGAGASIVIAIAGLAASGIVGNAAWDALVAGFKVIGSMGRDADHRSMERDEAVQRARWRVATAYDTVTVADLQHVGESHDREHDRWTIELQTQDGTRFSVVLGLIDGLPYTSRISRRAPDV